MTQGRFGEAELDGGSCVGFEGRFGGSKSLGAGLLREGSSGEALTCGWPVVSQVGMRLPPRKAFAVELEV